MVGHFDRLGRWRCPEWRAFVRTLRCGCGDPRCPMCSLVQGNAHIVAAHLRSMAGMGAKPDDFLVYPLTDAVHTAFHGGGQPGVAWQLERVTAALRAGLRAGVLVVDPAAADWGLVEL